jgi:RimJ/RimL family protein N-acetyltransferase
VDKSKQDRGAPAPPYAGSGTVSAMTSFPEVRISADRLDIREYGPGDAARVEQALGLGGPEGLPPGGPAQPGEIAGWLADGVHAPRRAGTGVHLMLLDRASDRIVGSISLFHADWEIRSAEIGYGVLGDQRGQGYATEALAAVSRWALSAGGVQRAWLTANTDNVASIRVAEKAGLTREGTLRRAGLEDDGLHDLAVFSLLDDEA